MAVNYSNNSYLGPSCFSLSVSFVFLQLENFANEWFGCIVLLLSHIGTYYQLFLVVQAAHYQRTVHAMTLLCTGSCALFSYRARHDAILSSNGTKNSASLSFL